MDKKLSKEKIRVLTNAAFFDACLLYSLFILLRGDRSHEDVLKMTLTTYITSLPAIYKHGIEDTGIWDEFLGHRYELLVSEADKRFRGFRENAEAALIDRTKSRRVGRPAKLLKEDPDPSESL